MYERFKEIYGTAVLTFILTWICSTMIIAVLGKTLGVHRFIAKACISLFEYLSTPSEQSISREEEFTNSYRKSLNIIIEPPNPFKIDITITLVNDVLNNIIEDEVTKRFESEEVLVWNLLTRNGRNIQLSSNKLKLAWMIGFLIRYFLLLPCRLVYLLCTLIAFYIALLVQCICLPVLFNGETLSRSRIYVADKAYLVIFRLLSRVVSMVIETHGTPSVNHAKCIVANHTTPLDVAILSVNSVYTLVGQKQGGLFGFIQRCLNVISGSQRHIWFERSSSSERHRVIEIMKTHVNEDHSNPILIFPEGTCINNTSLMMFRKGAFILDVPLQPVVIKYDIRFGDAFWNSQRYSFGKYAYWLLTGWGIWANVYYMDTVIRDKVNNETPDEFAKRVKQLIAIKGGFVNMDWDGMLKRNKPDPKWKEAMQVKVSNALKM